MNLSESIIQARDWTRKMREALEVDDTARALDLLPGRAAAMSVFENTHRAAGDAALEACRRALLSLQQEDASLQELGLRALRDTDEACRANLGAAPAGTTAYRDEPTLACVDRRA